MLSAWVVRRLGHKRLTALTAADLSRITRSPRRWRPDWSPLSNRSVRYAHTVLGRALGDPVEWGLLTRNPPLLG